MSVSQLNKLQLRYELLSQVADPAVRGSEQLVQCEVSALAVLHEKEAEIQRLMAALQSQHGLEAAIQLSAASVGARKQKKHRKAVKVGSDVQVEDASAMQTSEEVAESTVPTDVIDITLEGLIDSVCPDGVVDDSDAGSDSDDDSDVGDGHDNEVDRQYLVKQMETKAQLDKLTGLLKAKQELCKLTEANGIDGKAYAEEKRKSDEEVRRNEDEVAKLTNEVRHAFVL